MVVVWGHIQRLVKAGIGIVTQGGVLLGGAPPPAARRVGISSYQDVCALGTGKSGGQYQVTDQLALDVYVILLHHAMLQIRGLVIEVSLKCRGGGRSRNGLKSGGETNGGGRLIEGGRAIRGGK